MQRPVLGKVLVASAPLVLLVACLSSNPGQEDSSEPASGGLSSSGGSAETTLGELMTTTEEPESEDSGAGASTVAEESTESGESTVAIPATCGDGVLDVGEECDNGAANANDAACTLACKHARCGDGYVQMNEEACDDGVNDGAYGGCMEDCNTRAPHCGDLVVQDIEECDDDSPELGCMKNCSRAASCQQVQDSWADAAISGMYKIFPKLDDEDFAVDAYCDMTTDGGGYTFVKFGVNEAQTAMGAEGMCGEVGLHLLIPRTAAHLAASYDVAADLDLLPLGDNVPAKASGYLKIFGVYPVTAGESCVDQPLNTEACPQWRAADEGTFWISDAPLAAGQPATNNCVGCSMAYYWIGQELSSYEVIYAAGEGADSQYFLCDAGDKVGMN